MILIVIGLILFIAGSLIGIFGLGYLIDKLRESIYDVEDKYEYYSELFDRAYDSAWALLIIGLGLLLVGVILA